MWISNPFLFLDEEKFKVRSTPYRMHELGEVWQPHSLSLCDGRSSNCRLVERKLAYEWYLDDEDVDFDVARLTPIQIIAGVGGVKITNLRVSRDVYYTQQVGATDFLATDAGREMMGDVKQFKRFRDARQRTTEFTVPSGSYFAARRQQHSQSRRPSLATQPFRQSANDRGTGVVQAGKVTQGAVRDKCKKSRARSLRQRRREAATSARGRRRSKRRRPKAASSRLLRKRRRVNASIDWLSRRLLRARLFPRITRGMT